MPANIDADMWKSIARDLNNAQVDALERYENDPEIYGGWMELWNDIFLKMERRMNMYSRDFSRTQFRMLAGYTESI